MIRKLLLMGLLAISTAIHAHSPLVGADPANGATVTEAPQSLRLQFKRDVRMISAVLEQVSGSKQRLAVAKKLSTDHSLALGPVNSGKVTVRWKALSTDGHSMQGAVSFTVKP